MSGPAARGKAGICSLFVAWPSRFTGQYGREAHLTQNNLLADGEPSVISAAAAAQSPLFFLGLLGAILRRVSVTEPAKTAR